MKNNKVTPKTKRYQTVFIIHCLALALMLMSTKCSKDNPEPEPKLPPATQTGENTFGCKINDTVFLPNGNNLYPSIGEPVYYTDWGGIGFNVNNIKDFSCTAHFDFTVDSCYAAGDSPIIRDNDDLFSGCISSGDFETYYLDTTNSYNKVQITRLDLNEKIVSGTFQYRLINYDNGDTLSITEGRFDLGNLYVY